MQAVSGGLFGVTEDEECSLNSKYEWTDTCHRALCERLTSSSSTGLDHYLDYEEEGVVAPRFLPYSSSSIRGRVVSQQQLQHREVQEELSSFPSPECSQKKLGDAKELIQFSSSCIGGRGTTKQAAAAAAVLGNGSTSVLLPTIITAAAASQGINHDDPKPTTPTSITSSTSQSNPLSRSSSSSLVTTTTNNTTSSPSIKVSSSSSNSSSLRIGAKPFYPPPTPPPPPTAATTIPSIVIGVGNMAVTIRASASSVAIHSPPREPPKKQEQEEVVAAVDVVLRQDVGALCREEKVKKNLKVSHLRLDAKPFCPPTEPTAAATDQSVSASASLSCVIPLASTGDGGGSDEGVASFVSSNSSSGVFNGDLTTSADQKQTASDGLRIEAKPFTPALLRKFTFAEKLETMLIEYKIRTGCEGIPTSDFHQECQRANICKTLGEGNAALRYSVTHGYLEKTPSGDPRQKRGKGRYNLILLPFLPV